MSKKANGVKVLKGESREAELERRAVDAESRAAGQREVFRETEIGLQTKIAELMGTVANRDQELVEADCQHNETCEDLTYLVRIRDERIAQWERRFARLEEQHEKLIKFVAAEHSMRAMGIDFDELYEFVHDVEELDDEDDACPCCAG